MPVQREEVRVEREPITDANLDAATSGPAISEEEHEVTLREEGRSATSGPCQASGSAPGHRDGHRRAPGRRGGPQGADRGRRRPVHRPRRPRLIQSAGREPPCRRTWRLPSADCGFTERREFSWQTPSPPVSPTRTEPGWPARPGSASCRCCHPRRRGHRVRQLRDPARPRLRHRRRGRCQHRLWDAGLAGGRDRRRHHGRRRAPARLPVRRVRRRPDGPAGRLAERPGRVRAGHPGPGHPGRHPQLSGRPGRPQRRLHRAREPAQHRHPDLGDEWAQIGTIVGLGSLLAMLVGSVLGIRERWHSKQPRPVHTETRTVVDQPAGRDRDRSDDSDDAGATRMTSPDRTEPGGRPRQRSGNSMATCDPRGDGTGAVATGRRNRADGAASGRPPERFQPHPARCSADAGQAGRLELAAAGRADRRRAPALPAHPAQGHRRAGDRGPVPGHPAGPAGALAGGRGWKHLPAVLAVFGGAPCW